MKRFCKRTERQWAHGEVTLHSSLSSCSWTDSYYRELLGGGEPGQDLAPFSRPRLKVTAHFLFFFLSLPPQLLRMIKIKIQWAPCLQPCEIFIFCHGPASHHGRAAMRHCRSFAGWSGSKEGQRVGAFQHGAQRVRSHGAGGRWRRRCAAFPGSTPGLGVCDLKEKQWL